VGIRRLALIELAEHVVGCRDQRLVGQSRRGCNSAEKLDGSLVLLSFGEGVEAVE
jgi:hypothetical protein